MTVRCAPIALCIGLLTLVFALGVGTVRAANDAAPPSAPESSAAPEASAPSDASSGSSGSSNGTAQASGTKAPSKGAVKLYYKKGVRIESEDGNFKARIRWRIQTRITDLSSPDLVGEEDGLQEEAGFLIRRARFKLDGHAYRPWLGYYLEYGIAGGFLLTWQMELNKVDQARLTVGQYKVLYNRERVDSSGKQQFADRSIVNSPFTIDRQSGLTLHGRLFEGTRADSKYAVGVFTGTGRGGDLDSDRSPMYLARWQWNFFKRDLPYSQSDVEIHEKPAASIALAASTNVSEFTRFSSGGGGQLPGFDPGVPEQYKLEQWMGEFALKHMGLSLQGEYHFKRIDDRVNQQITELDGFYAQAGYFFHQLFDGFPAPLEIAGRIAAVDSDQGVEIPADREATLGLNWFFAGHDNKLTFDVSRLESTLAGGSTDRGWRARFQWDISF